ncbi:MAG TPA: DUF6065 family protein [Herpetosiphonaceae bacterium]
MLPYHHSLVRDGAGDSLICFPFVTQAGLDTLAHQFAVRDSDVFIVSYPKSGTNWVRQIVHLLMHDGLQGNQPLYETVPLLERAASQAQLAARNNHSERRCFISHLPDHLMPGLADTQARYIVVARNPKDCAVSYFHFMLHRADLQYQGSWEEFFEFFMQGQLPYGAWFDHVLAWWRASQHAENILFLTYEDLHNDLAAAVGRIAGLLDIPLTPALHGRVVVQSSFAAMSANLKGNGSSPQEQYSNLMLRKGVVGDWRNHFNPAQNARLDVLYREKMAGTGLRLMFDLDQARTITAYRLYDHAVPLQPAPDTRAFLNGNTTLAADRALHAAQRQGWEVLCPYAVEATWTGGPAPEDIVIRSDMPDEDAPSFVQSVLGHGLLTFYPGYQCKTEAGEALWVRGPINWPKDGLAPLEQILDTAVLPCTVVVQWQFTRPQQTIRFAAGEPFGTLLLTPTHAQNNATFDVVQLDAEGDLDAYDQAVQQMIDSAAVQDVFQRIRATPSETPDNVQHVQQPDRAMCDSTELAEVPPIPNVFHFIFFRPDNPEIPFSLVHYLAIKSAFEVNHPDVINLYYSHEGSGEWWEKAKPYVNLVRVEPPHQIFGQPLYHYAHQADVLRLQLLIEHGGVYLDMDVICTKPFTPFLQYPFVLGQEGQGDHSLCNAVMLAQKNAPFAQKWLAGFDPKTSLWYGFRSKGRDNYWAEYGVLYPAYLAKLFPELVHIERYDTFHWPLWHDAHLKWLFEENSDSFETSYCHHLWQALSWKPYLRDLTVEHITRVDTNFNRIARRFL